MHSIYVDIYHTVKLLSGNFLSRTRRKDLIDSFPRMELDAYQVGLQRATYYQIYFQMNMFSRLSSLAVLVAMAHAQVMITNTKQPSQMTSQTAKFGHSDEEKNVLTGATALVNKNNAAVDNNIGVSDSNVLLTQNDHFHVNKQSGTVRIRGASEDNEDMDRDEFWGGYPNYGYHYRYRYGW